jgi:hypothetical protein
MDAFDIGLSVSKTVAVYTCAKFGWPDALDSGPKTIPELARFAGVSDVMAHRTLRACESVGVFRKLHGGYDYDRYENTPLARGYLARRPSLHV